MNVLHIGKFDQLGGAAIAGWRVHRALELMGASSRMLVGETTCEDPSVKAIPKVPGEQLLGKLTWQLGLNNVHVVSTFGLIRHPWFKWADVVLFNNLHNGFFNYLALPALSKKKLFWLLHDMWAFTGHCSYSFDCDRWQQRCGSCPYPETYPYIKRDATACELKLKKWAYRRSNLHWITPSEWLARQTRKSILNCRPGLAIPYPVDTDIYKPQSTQEARKVLGIHTDKTVLLAVSHSFADKRKGGDVLIEALAKLPLASRRSLLLLVMGGEIPDTQIEGLEIETTGYVREDEAKRTVYSSADALLFLSKQDNLPLVIQESLCCGTPVIANRVGGVEEMVHEGCTGMLIDSLDPVELSKCVQECLDAPDRLVALRAGARNHAERTFHSGRIGATYLDLFNGMDVSNHAKVEL
jgi:glycosyltransferase involved in cell wall biosynthesis